jgi:hypothetical protein
MAAVGIILAWRWRTVATALAAVGFGSIAICNVLGALLGVYVFGRPDDVAAAASRLAWTIPVTHWGSLLGIWIGSLGLLWHTLTDAGVTSPCIRPAQQVTASMRPGGVE